LSGPSAWFQPDLPKLAYAGSTTAGSLPLSGRHPFSHRAFAVAGGHRA